jgi:hypothetical protein
MYPLVSNLYSIAVIQPLSTAEVERIFSQVALNKTSHGANIKTETLSKILNIKYNCDKTLFNSIIDEYMPCLNTKTEDLVKIVSGTFITLIFFLAHVFLLIFRF